MTTRRWLALAALGALAALWFSTPAKADPDRVANYAAYNAGRVCRTLDKYPSLPGVQGLLEAVQNDSGFGDYETGRVVALAVTAACPWHWPLLQNFAATWAGPAYTGGTSI